MCSLSVWETRTLGEIAALRRGITYNSDTIGDEDGGFPYLNMKSFLKGGGFNPYGTKRYAGHFKPADLVDKSDLLLANTDVTAGDIVGAPALPPAELFGQPVLFSHHVTRVRLLTPIDRAYLYYLLCLPEYRSHMLRIARGTTVLMLDMEALKRVPVRTPQCTSMQQRMVEILSTLDEAAAKTEALIFKTRQIKAGLMRDVFTRGVTSDGRLRPSREEAPHLYKESALGWIPNEWETFLLDDIAVRGSGHTPNKNHPEYWNGTIKWISLADSWRLDRLHISDTDHKITQAGIENSSAVLHAPGVVVLSRDAGVGKSAITTCEMAVSQHFMCWHCGPRLNNYYLYYWLQFRRWEFENIATGSTIPTIGLNFFRRYRMCAPTEIREQESITATLVAADENLFRLEEDFQKLKLLRAGLMHDLLTGHTPVTAELRQSVAKVAANV